MAPRPPGRYDRTGAVERYAAGLGRHFFDPATIDAVAGALEMSRRRFTPLFREVTGSTWANHRAGLRVAYAGQLLEETDRSIVAIAFESCFEVLSSFYRAFRRRAGVAPNRWRREHRGGSGGRSSAAVTLEPGHFRRET